MASSNPSTPSKQSHGPPESPKGNSDTSSLPSEEQKHAANSNLPPTEPSSAGNLARASENSVNNHRNASNSEKGHTNQRSSYSAAEGEVRNTILRLKEHLALQAWVPPTLNITSIGDESFHRCVAAETLNRKVSFLKLRLDKALIQSPTFTKAKTGINRWMAKREQLLKGYSLDRVPARAKRILAAAEIDSHCLQTGNMPTLGEGLCSQIPCQGTLHIFGSYSDEDRRKWVDDL